MDKGPHRQHCNYGAIVNFDLLHLEHVALRCPIGWWCQAPDVQREEGRMPGRGTGAPRKQGGAVLGGRH